MIDIDSAFAHLFARKEETKNRWFACFICQRQQQQQKNKEKNTLHFGPEVTQVPLLIRFWSRRVESLELASPLSILQSHSHCPYLSGARKWFHTLPSPRVEALANAAYELRVYSARFSRTAPHAHSIPFRWRFAFADVLHSSACHDAALRSVDFFCFHAERQALFKSPSLSLCGVASGDSLDMLPVAARWFRNEVFAT